MKKGICLILAIVALSCNNKAKVNYKASFGSVTTDTLFNDDISIRAIVADGDKLWYAGSKGKYGWVSLSGGKDFNGVAVQDTLMPEFRSIAQTSENIFILNAGTPALLYKVSKDGKFTKIVYEETGEKVFYDSMQFRNDKDGIAIGDPVNGCISVITTSDGGNTWNKVDCKSIPLAADGEAAFAASNSNLVVKNDLTWIASGGKKSRIYLSKDKGVSWKVYDTPIVQGKEMTGIFSLDFYDGEVGFAVGGDYERQDDNSNNKIFTEDGGETWKRVGENDGFGYASCVQFLPGSNGNELLTAGPSGIFYSYDRGESWRKIVGEKNMHTIRFVDSETVIAAGQNTILRLRLK